MMNTVISSCILYSGKLEITFGSLRKMAQLLFNYLKQRGVTSYLGRGPFNHTIQEVCLCLGAKIDGNPMNRKTGDKVKIQFKESVLPKLKFYTSKLSNYFCHESVIAYSILIN